MLKWLSTDFFQLYSIHCASLFLQTRPIYISIFLPLTCSSLSPSISSVLFFPLPLHSIALYLCPSSPLPHPIFVRPSLFPALFLPSHSVSSHLYLSLCPSISIISLYHNYYTLSPPPLSFSPYHIPLPPPPPLSFFLYLISISPPPSLFFYRSYCFHPLPLPLYHSPSYSLSLHSFSLHLYPIAPFITYSPPLSFFSLYIPLSLSVIHHLPLVLFTLYLSISIIHPPPLVLFNLNIYKLFASPPSPSRPQCLQTVCITLDNSIVYRVFLSHFSSSSPNRNVYRLFVSPPPPIAMSTDYLYPLLPQKQYL